MSAIPGKRRSLYQLCPRPISHRLATFPMLRLSANTGETTSAASTAKSVSIAAARTQPCFFGRWAQHCTRRVAEYVPEVTLQAFRLLTHACAHSPTTVQITWFSFPRLLLTAAVLTPTHSSSLSRRPPADIPTEKREQLEKLQKAASAVAQDLNMRLDEIVGKP